MRCNNRISQLHDHQRHARCSAQGWADVDVEMPRASQYTRTTSSTTGLKVVCMWVCVVRVFTNRIMKIWLLRAQTPSVRWLLMNIIHTRWHVGTTDCARCVFLCAERRWERTHDNDDDDSDVLLKTKGMRWVNGGWWIGVTVRENMLACGTASTTCGEN